MKLKHHHQLRGHRYRAERRRRRRYSRTMTYRVYDSRWNLLGVMP